MAEVLSFYSVAPSQGKRTLSLSFAEMLAEQQHRVLYVELDYKHPSVAIATQITHNTKNAVEYFQESVMKKTFALEPYVLSKDDLLINSDQKLKRIYSRLPSKLEYLVLPLNFHENSFPSIISDVNNAEQQAQEFIQKFIYSLKSSKYHYIVLNLPNELQSVFGFEVISNSDQVINVVTPSANRIYEFKKIEAFLSKNIPGFDSKVSTVINMANPSISDEEYNQLLRSDLIVHYDSERQLEELSLRPGSEQIMQQLEVLAIHLNISVTLTTAKKKPFFSRR